MVFAISDAEAIRFAEAAGFSGDGLRTVIAIAHAESSLIPDARNRNTDGSIDRGILQINDRAHPEVSDAQADNPATAFRAGFQISSRGTNFTPWSTFNSGAYKRFLGQNGKQPTPTVMQLDRPFHVPSGVDPTSLVTQPFGNNFPGVEPLGFKFPDVSIWYVAAPDVEEGCWHNGVDYRLAMGTPLFAPHDGTVVYAAVGQPNTQPVDTRGFGNCLVIRHMQLGIYTLYGHLSRFDVAMNQHVARGEPIAQVGSTGNSSGPHLHWSTIRMSDGHYVNPAQFLQTPMQDPIRNETFTVTADIDGDPVRVFSGPSRQTVSLRLIQPGSQIQCTGWTFGEPRHDKSAGGAMDARWYRLADGGWVASARVMGNPLDSTPMP